MFIRRKPLTKLQHLKEIFWPTMGWMRACQYVKHRVIRLSDSDHRIAAGLATGASISFTPLVGTHFIQAGSIAYIFRFNFIAALIGTFVGNPWTFPFMWWAAIEFGSFLFELVGLPSSKALPDVVTLPIMWDLLWHQPLRIFLPWLLGGYLLGLFSWPFSYVIFYNLVRGAKAARKKAKLMRMHKTAKEITGQKQ